MPTGGKVTSPSLFPPDIAKSAVMSWCLQYRYELRRTWNHAKERILCFLMLNPSSADADIDDPTVRRCIGFGRSLGYDGIVVVNLFALRATKPTDLLRHPEPIGPSNDAFIDSAIAESSFLIAAWGGFPSHKKITADRTIGVLSRIHPPRIHVLGETAAGEPQHPLYIPADRKPKRWEP